MSSRAHLRTFQDVFSNVVAAFGPGGFGTFMVGSDAPMALTEGNVRAILSRPGMVEDLSSAFRFPS